MSDPSVNLSLPFIQPAQAQKHVTHNEALRILDAVVQLAVVSHTLTSAPADPAEGARYIVAQGATGTWAGQDGQLAVAQSGGWVFYTPGPGWRAFSAELGSDIQWQGGAWQEVGFNNLPGVGINASADVTNRLAVSADATLLNHDGAGHQVKINKAGAGETTSLLFQTGFSGRAEMGTAGSDDFAIKVSADGAAWNTAVSVAADTGVPDLAAGATVGGQGAYHRGNLVGMVSQSAGQPTGAVIEQGSTAQGDYVRFADGTQICWVEITTSASASVSWNYPVDFIAAPHVSGTMAVDAAEFVTTTAAGDGMAVSLSGWSHDGSRVASPARLTAVGRWF